MSCLLLVTPFCQYLWCCTNRVLYSIAKKRLLLGAKAAVRSGRASLLHKEVVGLQLPSFLLIFKLESSVFTICLLRMTNIYRTPRKTLFIHNIIPQVLQRPLA
ncbi:hypothetical protein BGZ57DRAFT_609555 [Hyaloscypha finlandica]|nr:hypothetical protein BGZ57DRAFT_609555 [Hyaloscypha finlandica]